MKIQKTTLQEETNAVYACEFYLAAIYFIITAETYKINLSPFFPSFDRRGVTFRENDHEKIDPGSSPG
jgi:hypothetical protein